MNMRWNAKRMGLTVSIAALLTSPVLAGPFSMEQLRAWMAEAQHELDQVRTSIGLVGEQFRLQQLNVLRLERLVAGSASSDPMYVEQLRAARRSLLELGAQLNALRAKERELLARIEWIQGQIAVWQEMNKHGG